LETASTLEVQTAHPAAIAERTPGKDMEPLLNEQDVATLTGMSLATVRRWRLLKQGPCFIKIGSAVRYRPEDLSKWIDGRPRYAGGGVAA